MKKRIRNRPYFLAVGAATASLIAGCGQNDQEKWADAPGTKGHINLEAVKLAFQKNHRYDDFEKRVNEIFEGDRLVIFKAEEATGGFKYTATEDLDGDKKIGPADDALFTLLVANGTATLKGLGVNSYYSESWPYDPASAAKQDPDTKETAEPDETVVHHHHHGTHFYHWYGYRGYGWGGGYYTSARRYGDISRHRDSYRGTSSFQSQVKQNAANENYMASRHGTGFRKTTPSSTRTSYISKNRGSSSVGTAKKSTSGWAVRSRTGVKSTATSSSSSKSSSRSSASRGGSRGGFGGFRGSSGFGV